MRRIQIELLGLRGGSSKACIQNNNVLEHAERMGLVSCDGHEKYLSFTFLFS